MCRIATATTIFLRDVAKPVLEADSHAKVQMRHKVRGLRKIEQAVLQRPSVRPPSVTAVTRRRKTWRQTILKPH